MAFIESLEISGLEAPWFPLIVAQPSAQADHQPQGWFLETEGVVAAVGGGLARR